MRRSLESTRPILATTREASSSNRASTRYSSYSLASSMAQSATSSHSDPDMRKYSIALERLDSGKLQDQRYSLSRTQTDDMNKLALGAKVQKAVDRRFYDQDAEMKKKKSSKLSEKKS